MPGRRHPPGGPAHGLSTLSFPVGDADVGDPINRPPRILHPQILVVPQRQPHVLVTEDPCDDVNGHPVPQHPGGSCSP